MSNLFAVSFDVLSSPTLEVNEKSLAIEEEKGNGWGIGWYPNDNYSASVVKDIVYGSVQGFSETLSNWKNFRSSLFLLKMMSSKKAYTQHNTQPFQKSLGGREWIFIHRGTLEKESFNKKLTSKNSPFEPLGNTDSELVFCSLLDNIFSKGAKRISDIDFNVFNKLLNKYNQYGTSDYLLTDGQTLIAYSDISGANPLHYKRILPPHSKELFKSDLFTFNVQDAATSNRTVLMISSFDQNMDNSWKRIEPGQMIVVRRGNIVWQGKVHKKATIENQEKSETKMSEVILEPDVQNICIDEHQNILNVKAITETKAGQPLHYKTYQVTHTTQYQYGSPIEKSTHTLRLQPVDDQIQELVKSTLNLTVDCEQLSYEDVFGNQSVTLNVEQPYNEMTITCESIVKVFQRPPDDFSVSLRRPSIPINWMPWQRQMMLSYLLPPELPESQLLELYEFAMSFVERNDYELLPTLQDMNKQIFEDFTYKTGSTNIETTPFEVFTTRQGVCQDFANLLICMARILGVPARYQVGYIHTGADYKNTEQADASHAWVELYLPYIGWRGFDPTNGCMVSQDHIRVACGRHYRDATPTSGTIYIGDGTNETMHVSVKVEELS